MTVVAVVIPAKANRMKPPKNTEKTPAKKESEPKLTAFSSEKAPALDWVDVLTQEELKPGVFRHKPRADGPAVPIHKSIEQSALELRSKTNITIPVNKSHIRDGREILDQQPEESISETSLPSVEQTGGLKAVLAAVPTDAPYEVQAGQLAGLNRGFRQELAKRLLPALKEEMQRQPHETYDQKIELVRWVNAELRRFDLAIRHPKTGQPAAFKPFLGNDPEIGAFRLEDKDADGTLKTFTTPHLATLLDKLELMESPPRREGLTEWQETVGRQRRGAKRG